ncbi:hypothetical protein NKH77_19445 [Streptomyces sp. M19]
MGEEAGPGARRAGVPALRDHCYAAHREHSPALAALWWLGGGDAAQDGWAAPGSPRWPGGWSARLPEPAALVVGRRGRALLDAERHPGSARGTRRTTVATPGLLRLRRPRDPAGAERGAYPEAFDNLLLYALLADLREALRPGRISPWRRRRRTRGVVLLEPFRAAARAPVTAVAARPAPRAPSCGGTSTPSRSRGVPRCW